MVHDVYPAILRGENEKSHKSIEDVVEVVFLIDPLVPGVLETVNLACDVLCLHCRPVTEEEQSFEQLEKTYNRFSGEGVKNLT